MIEIPPVLQAKLEAGVTTLSWCWVLTRRDGQVLGFTDHDRNLNVAGVDCEPSSGFTAGSTRIETGASPARAAVFGTLNSERVRDIDLDNGLWDSARVELYRVDWSEPSLYFKTFTGELGAVSRTAAGFEAEVQGLTARLNARIGEVFSRRCSAALGDQRCGVDLAQDHTHLAEVASVLSSTGLLVTVAQPASPDWFRLGALTWISGANSGAHHRIRVDRVQGSGRVIELDPAPSTPPATSDQALIVPGCDKRFKTCREKFSNAMNFRGCPHMPGNDLLLRHAASEEVRDGSAR